MLFFNTPATTQTTPYLHTLSLHDALPTAVGRTYTWLAGSSPTSTTARPGVRPCSAFSPVTAAATRAVNPAAKALPSIKSASPAVLLAALLVKALSPIDLAGGASSPERRGRRLSD